MKIIQKANCNKKEKGITIISLVVTIIVLLILASIGIGIISGEEGIISTTQNAKKEAEQTSKEIERNEENFVGSLNNGYTASDEYKNIITIIYDTNGGEGGPIKSTITAEDINNSEIKISEKVPERLGYTFVGWSKDKEATEPEYKPGDTYPFDKNITIYAVWKKDQTALTINPNGGKWRNSRENTIIEGKKGESITIENSTPPEGYKVTFNGNGGSTPVAITSTKSFTS